MMRGRKAVVTVVRRSTGDLAMNIQPLSSIYTSRITKIPLLRGVVVLIEAMILGIRSLLYSANVSLEEEEEELSKKSIFVMLASALALVVVLFFIAPLFLTRLGNPYIHSSLTFHLI